MLTTPHRPYHTRCVPTPAASYCTHLQTYLEKEGDKKMKQKARDRMQPKMGKLDIDYQVSTGVLYMVLRSVVLYSVILCSVLWNAAQHTAQCRYSVLC